LIGSMPCWPEDKSTQSFVGNSSLLKTGWRGAPSTKESSASSVDSLPRFGDMDPKSDMLASSREDTIAFDSPEKLSS
jgi:hypothetical protein